MEGHADQARGQPQLAEWMAHLDQKMDSIVEMHRQMLRRFQSPLVREEGQSSNGSNALQEWRELLLRGSRSPIDATQSVSLEEQPPAPRLEDPEAAVEYSNLPAADGSKATADLRTQRSTETVENKASEKSEKSAGSNGIRRSMRPWLKSSKTMESDKSTGSEKSMRTTRNELFLKRRSTQLERKITKSLERGVTASSSFSSSSVPGRIIKSNTFDMFITVVIVLNSFLIGVQVQHKAVSESEAEPGWFTLAEYACTVLFAVELFVRMAVLRWEFFTNLDERWWNAFDAFLVGVSFVDFCLNELTDTTMPGSSSFISKLGRAIRIARIMRIIRTVRFLSQLRIMLKMIVDSLKSLFWILIVLAGVIYSFSIVLTQSATDYLMHSSSATPADHAAVRRFFGSLFETMYTLFQCISGGLNWGEASVLMRGPGWFLEAIVVVYVFFVIFAVANIVNGVFVDGAIELAKRDRMTIIDKQKKDDQAKQAHLVRLLEEMDADGDGNISFFEFCDSLESEHVQDYISALQLEISDAKAFFALLDSDGVGNVNIVDFVSGMMKLRGEARSVDVHMMLHQNIKLTRLVHGLADAFRDRAKEQPPAAAPPAATAVAAAVV